MSKLKAVILVGGPGMRLRPLTEDRPKSVVPVLNRPAMDYIFAHLKMYGIEDIILTMNYLPEVIQSYFGDGSRSGVHLTYCLEKEPAGTAGAVKNAESYIDDTFLVLNGDIFTDLDLGKMLSFHRKQKAKATIALTWVADPSAFGVVETDENQKVSRFIEKPPPNEATSHWINAGTYILEPDVLKYIPANTHYMFERGLFPGLLAAGEPVYGQLYRGYWLDMGNPRAYFSLNMDYLSSKVRNPFNGKSPKNKLVYGTRVSIDSSAEITAPAIIGDGCRIGPRVKINGPAIIGPGCRLAEDAIVENAILWDNVAVEAGVKINHCIVGSRTNIKGSTELVDCVLTPLSKAPLPL
jgi:mannose-1-phosphate guanylyltransferase